MGKPTGFLEIQRETPKKRNANERLHDYNEIDIDLSEDKVEKQAARCMDCGTPFCHSGCPLGNIIPEFNDAVYEQNWGYAYEILSSTNNFPEFTGRICPAPCEASCVLGINKPPVTIEYIEKSIIEHAFSNGLVVPKIPAVRTGKKIVVVGSGPSGLAAAAQLNQAGHWVTVFERDDQIGGLLRYGIPDFKLEKSVIDRRLEVMVEEGITFKTRVNVGYDIKAADLIDDYDLIMLCGGSTIPRDVPIPGRELNGVHFAMEFLPQQNARVGKREPWWEKDILANGKNVVVIGGGDTGSDCVGTSNRQGAKSITQIELMPMPPTERASSTPWPLWPMMLRTSTSHDEGCDRHWAIQTKEFIGDENGNLKALKIVELDWKHENGKMGMFEKHETTREIPCELALIAAGFLHPQKAGLLADLELELDERGNIKANNYQTSVPKVFSAGDMRRGQSLVVWAISEGREAARAADLYLMGETKLEAKAISGFEIA